MKKSNTQIGGKGSIRINQKTKIKKLDKEYVKYKQNIDVINKKLLSLNKQYYIKFQSVLNSLVLESFKNLKREDINKSNGLRYSNINKQGIEYIYENFFYKINDFKILLKSDIYSYIKNNFKNSGKKIFYKLVEDIDNMLVQKEYNVDIESKKYNYEQFERALEYFDLNTNNKVHFKKIKEKYTEYLDNIEYNNQNTNMYFTIIKNQYNEYLKNY